MVRQRLVHHNIYIVDDDESVRRALARLIRSAGFECAAFESGEALLAHVSAETRGCVVMDIRMPGLTGHDLQRRLAEGGSKLAVIAVSAQDDTETRQRARDLGAVAFFRKPVDDQALLDAIQWALDDTERARG